MAASKRVKRPKLERHAPKRSFLDAVKGEERGSRRKATAPAESTPAERSDFRTEAYDAVNSGYRVIDEYMRQGQRLAEEFWLPLPGSNGALPDFSRIMDRFLRSAGDMGNAWFEMMTEWTKPAVNGAAPHGSAGPFTAGRVNGHAGSGAAVATSPGGDIAVEIESSRKVRVTVETRAALENIDVHLLTASDRSLPPITNVRVQVDPASGHAVLTVSVPDDQPPGAYYGVLLDRVGARPAGTITVIVG